MRQIKMVFSAEDKAVITHYVEKRYCLQDMERKSREKLEIFLTKRVVQ